MSAPTRAQISATVTAPTFEVEIKPAGSWVDVSSDVISINHVVETRGDISGFAFGSSVGATATVQIDVGAFDLDWQNVPIRIAYGFASSAKINRFAGLIVGRDRGADDGAWQCRGWDALIEGIPIYSPLFYRRPIATRTGAATVEDPTDGAYAGGLINYILWQCGGRPLEQAGSYTDATFYYSATQALIAPEWSWISADNAWDELGRLCRACGGQIYQDDEGVVRYVDPISLVPSSAAFGYTDEALTAAQRVSQAKEEYADIQSTEEVFKAVSGVTCTYVSRLVQGVQEVYSDSTPRLIAAGETLTLTLDTQFPIYRVARCEATVANMRTAAALTSAQVTITVTDVRAQRTTVTIWNATAEPAMIYEVRLFGRPVSAGEEGSASFSPGGGVLVTDRTLPIEDSPYVQSRSHAEMLCRMVWDFYAVPRAIITLGGCMYDPDRYVGEAVTLTYGPWDLDDALCRITAIRPTDGDEMEVDLCPADGLPVWDDHFILDETYADADVRALGY